MTDTPALFDVDLAPAPDAVAGADDGGDAGAAGVPTDRAPADRAPTDRPTVLAVDGNALVHRAFHAYGATTGGARYGFFALLSVVCDQVAYDGLLVGFDCRRSSVRRDRYPAYKAHRPDKDAALDASLDELPGIAGDMGVHVVEAFGWEADDVLASTVHAAGTQGWACVAASPDRDVLGLVGPTTQVLQVRGGGQPIRRVDLRTYRRRFGIRPGQYAELAALRGDGSDNLPGVPGIGAKKAAQLLRRYPTVAEAVADPLGCRSVLGAELGQALIDDLASPASVFRRNLALMQLRHDVPIDLEACRPVATPDRIMGVLHEWRMTGLHARMCAALCPRDDDVPPVGDDDAPPPPGRIG